MANIKSFPNNQDVYIGAEYVMRWLHGRTSGVFASGNNAAVTALDEPEMAVNVADGIGWISNSDSNGVVWWNDEKKENGAALKLNVDVAHESLDRIDRVIVDWETINYVAYPEIKILKGTPASSPAPPALTRSTSRQQISLARITIPAGSTEITARMITDERLDQSACGLVTDSISIDTSMMQAQFSAFLKAINMQLSELEAGTAVELKKLVFENTAVPVSAWANGGPEKDSTHGYHADVALDGVISNMFISVVFYNDDIDQCGFASMCDSYDGGVRIYAETKPSEAITIPTVICWKR